MPLEHALSVFICYLCIPENCIMGKGKLVKFADMAANPKVREYPYAMLRESGCPLKGKWGAEFFGNDHPIVLELGCGRGEYTVGLAHRFPDINFIGIDIKGARMWHGAKQALADGMDNVGFVRTNIEFLHEVFGPDEVSEIWLTFSDPQMKKVSRRLTSTFFMERYRQFLVDGGLIHLKTDSNFMATYTRLMALHNGLELECWTDDLYHSPFAAEDSPLVQIQTYYEQMWLARGLSIKYLRFRLPHDTHLEEPDVEIPIDEYRSYDHQVNTTVKTRR